MRSTSTTLLFSFQTTETTSGLARIITWSLHHNTHKGLKTRCIKGISMKRYIRTVSGKKKNITYDLSLPLCRSNSRFPRESKPSLRPMPRPLPPRPPLPPPRPLIGLSLTGLKKLMQNNCYNHSLAKVLSQWGKHFYCPVGGSKNKFSPLQHNTLISGFGFYKLLRESWTANCVYCLVLSFLFAWFFCCFSFSCCKQKLRIWKWINQLSNDLKLPVRLHTTEWDCTYNWFFLKGS